MMIRRFVYSMVVVFMTIASVAIMLQSREIDNAADMDYMYGYSDYENDGDREYIGFIFNDYNKPVNIDYVDKLSRNVDDGSVSILSPSVLDNTGYGDMKLDDRIDIMNMMRKMDDNEILKLKKLFDRGTGEDEVNSIIYSFGKRLTDNESARLSDMVKRYKYAE